MEDGDSSEPTDSWVSLVNICPFNRMRSGESRCGAFDKPMVFTSNVGSGSHLLVMLINHNMIREEGGDGREEMVEVDRKTSFFHVIIHGIRHYHDISFWLRCGEANYL